MPLLISLYDLFPRISEQALGNPDLDGIERAFGPFSRGEEEFSFRHIEILKDEEHRYWRFLDWWRIPEIKQTEIEELRELFGMRSAGRSAEFFAKGLWDVLKNIEIASCVLRFWDPDRFGILSPPVENLLNIRGSTAWEKYARYIDALEKLRAAYDLDRNAHVDMALWTLAHILNSAELRNYDRECKEIVDNFYGKPNLIKKIAAKNSLEQLFIEKDYLNIADMFVESDYEIAAFIAGREIERYLKELCRKHRIALKEVRDGFKRDKRVSTMLKDLSYVVNRDDKNRIKEWYQKRSDVVHDRNKVRIEEVEDIIMGLREFRERMFD
jgi:hypothetical protein